MAGKSNDSIGTATLATAGPLEFTVTTKDPDALVPQDLGALYRYYIVYDVAAADAAGNDTDALLRAGIYTGPFKPVKVSERELLATQFDEYWGGQPAQRELRLAAITDPAARVLAVRNGEADIAMNPPATSAGLDGTVTTYRRALIANRGVFVQFNLTAPPFDDPAVRRALLAGLDYPRLAGVAGPGVLRPATGLYPAELPFARKTQTTDRDRAQRSKSGRDLLFRALTGSAVQGRIVGCAVLPAAPYDPDPGSREDAGGVGVVLAGGPCAVVDLGGPDAGEAAVGGEGGDGRAKAFVAGPAERHAALFAGCLVRSADPWGDRGDPGQRGDRVGVVERGAGVARQLAAGR